MAGVEAGIDVARRGVGELELDVLGLGIAVGRHGDGDDVPRPPADFCFAWIRATREWLARSVEEERQLLMSESR